MCLIPSKINIFATQAGGDLKTVLAVVLFTKVLGLKKSESPRTLRVLGLSNITSPRTFAKSTTAKTLLR